MASAFGQDDEALPQWVTDAASGASEPEAAAETEPPPRPRRARSTFTTERTRPASRTAPLPPLDPLVPEIDRTEPVARDRPADPVEPVAPTSRVAVEPRRDSGEIVVVPPPVWGPPSTSVDIVVPPMPPMPEAEVEPEPEPEPAPPRRTRVRKTATVVEAEPTAPADPHLEPAIEAASEPEPAAPPSARDVAEPPPLTAGFSLRRHLRPERVSEPEGPAPTALSWVESDEREPEPVSEREQEREPEPTPEPEPALETEPPPAPVETSARRRGRCAVAARELEPLDDVAAPITTSPPDETAPAPTAPEQPHDGAEGEPEQPAEAPDAPSEPAEAPEPEAPAQHAGTRRAARLRRGAGLALAAMLILGGSAVVTATVAGATPAGAAAQSLAALTDEAELGASVPVPLPAPAQSIPAPEVSATPAYVEACSDPAFTAALDARDDARAIALAGGAESFRVTVAAGLAPCVPLDDPSHVWVVVNKTRPYNPLEYAPAQLAVPAGLRDLADSPLQPAAGAALAQMIAGAGASGVGEIALSSAYRSYGMQSATYRSQVRARGTEGADLVSARPGFSEHQSGLAADVVACVDGVCGGLDAFGDTAQCDWVAAHSWEYGWIVRYEDGRTGVSGYSPEPWHLRYVGVELAKAYHDGGYHTLEEFFGLPAAPDYAH